MAKSIRIPLAGLALTTLALAAAAQSSNAQAAQTRDYHIESQPLPAAVNDWADQAGMQVMWSAKMPGAQLEAPEVAGRFSAPMALERVLRGSGLTFAFLDEQTVAIRLASATGQSSSSPGASGGETQSASPAQAEGRGEDSKKSVRGADSAVASKEETISEVIVTGTHIRGVVPVGAPVRILDQEEIARSGYSTIEQLVQSIPENFKGGLAGASQDVNFSSRSISRNTYGAGVNLRGLGNTATLVLINGHRVASSGDGTFTDISTVPISAIERIDVLTDGASAIYGSDAIAGVINIVLKSDMQGVETGINAGAADDYSTFGANAQMGDRWDGGGITLGVDYSKQSSLNSSERNFTADVPSPTSIFPSYNQLALVGGFQQTLGSGITLHADTQYSDTSRLAYTTGGTTLRREPEVERWNGSVGFQWTPTNSWSLRYDLTAGREVRDNSLFSWADGHSTSLISKGTARSKLLDQNAALSGSLFSLPGGQVQLVLGGGYRNEGFEQFNHQSTGDLRYDADRNILSGYSEIQIPIVGESNALPGISNLTLNGAVRYDRYSDFGGTTNPKVGIAWSPIRSLKLRGAYSTSFRAPAAGSELINSEQGITAVLVQPTRASGGTTEVPLVLITGGQPNLKPESAENVTLGFDYLPPALEGLELSFNYYRISYTDQISDPPFSVDPLNEPALAPVIRRFPTSAELQSLTAAALAGGALYLDITGGVFGPDPLSSAVDLYDFRTQNLSRTKTSGFDLAINYSFPIGADELSVGLNGTYIDEFMTSLTSTSPTLSQVDTLGFPASLRIRGQGHWSHRELSISGAINYVDDYSDSSSPTPRTVESYVTVDLALRYDFSEGSIFNGTHASVSATNLFDEKPPFVFSGATSFSGSHYDAANASALGRYLRLQISRSW